MERDLNKYLFDVVQNCDRIDEFVGEIDFGEFKQNELIKSAVERRFINIGEALSRIKSEDATLFSKISNAQRIIGFRNILVHNYESISDNLVWGIVKEHLSELKVACEKLII